jgi:hypothetical protein
LSPGRISESRAITGKLVVRGLNPVLPPKREQGFVLPGPAGAPDRRRERFYVPRSAPALREQQLKPVVRSSTETRVVVRGIRNPAPNVGLSGIRNPLLRVEPGAAIRAREPYAVKLRLEGTVPTPPPEVPFRLIPQGEGRFTFETVTHGPLVSREKFVEAVAEYLATVLGDPAFDDATEFWHTESDPVTETVDAMEGVSRWLEITVDKPLKGLATGLGLSSDEAAVTAGISTDLILAPITGPLNKAESFIEVGGIIFGLLTGGHALVLACLKRLVHNEGKRLAVRGAVKMLTGSQSDRPRSNAPEAVGHNRRLPHEPKQAAISPLLHRPPHHDVPRPEQVPVLPAAPGTRHQWTPQEPLWKGLAFAPKPLTGSGAAGPAPATTARKRRTTKRPKPLVGDVTFFEPGPPPDGSGSEADVPTARRSSFLSRSEHGIIKVGGVGFGTSSGSRNLQAAYQHPGCHTGNCAPLGLPCRCPCGVCRAS